ncbi:rhodanese-like domain-containing protein [Geomonas terrae]|nr:rhodanese-like domain-containing protein [Geomonas terrae]
MMRMRSIHPLSEIALVVLLAALIGVARNKTLLTDAWRGEISKAAVVAQPAQAAEAVPMPVGLAQAKELHDSGQAVLVDARNADSFVKEHISGALSLPLAVADRKKPPLPKNVTPDTIIIAYCNGFSCHDSMELGKILIKAGYRQVFVFEGGLPEWRDAGYPTAGGAS